MFPKRNSARLIGVVLSDPVIQVVRRRPVEKSIMDSNGLISTVVALEEFNQFGDEGSNFRDYSIQTLINVNAIDLLKPLGSLPIGQLSASDLLGDLDVSISNIQSRLDEIKKAAVSVKTEVKTETKSE